MNTSHLNKNQPPSPAGLPSISQRAAAIRLAARYHGSSSSSSSKKSIEARGGRALILPEKEVSKATTTTMMEYNKSSNTAVIKKKKSKASNKIRTISSLNGMLLHPAIQKMEYIGDDGEHHERPIEEEQQAADPKKTVRDGGKSRFFNFSKNTRPRFMRSKNKEQYPRVEESRDDNEFVDEVDSNSDDTPVVGYGSK